MKKKIAIIYGVSLAFIVTVLIVSLVLTFRPLPIEPDYEVPIEEIPFDQLEAGFDLDLNTMCSEANQFGICFNSCVYTNDECVQVVRESYTQVDNVTGRGHVISLYPSHAIDVWFDTNNSACYTTISSESNIADWYVCNADEGADAFSKHLKSNIDYCQVINKLSDLVTLCQESRKERIVTEQGIWYIAAIPANIVEGSVAINPDKTIVRVFIPYDDLITQVDVINYYGENSYNITKEIAEYDFELNPGFNCDVPEIVIDASDDYTEISNLYMSIMN